MIDSEKVVNLMDKLIADIEKAKLNTVEIAALLGCIQSAIIISLVPIGLGIKQWD